MNLTRKEFLLGAGGLGAGLATGLPVGAIAHANNAPGERSYAQCGEDLIVQFILGHIGATDARYLDVGAHDPVIINNTYLFYTQGFRGVLVEPNPVMCEKIRAERPEDVTLTAGIGMSDVREADFYMMNDSSWNTFSKEEADHMVKTTKGEIRVEKVIKMQLLEINGVMEEHFGGAPEYLSIDAEGIHLDILKTVNFKKYRPMVICVETLVSGTKQTMPEIGQFLASRGYTQRGGSFVNGIFVDRRLLG